MSEEWTIVKADDERDGTFAALANWFQEHPNGTGRQASGDGRMLLKMHHGQLVWRDNGGTVRPPKVDEIVGDDWEVLPPAPGAVSRAEMLDVLRACEDWEGRHITNDQLRDKIRAIYNRPLGALENPFIPATRVPEAEFDILMLMEGPPGCWSYYLGHYRDGAYRTRDEIIEPIWYQKIAGLPSPPRREDD